MVSCSLTQRVAGCSQLRGASGARRVGRARAAALRVCAKLVLTPTGSGKTEHIGEDAALPAPITLKNGLFEIGRAPPADIVIPIPTVSTRHAVVRVVDSTGLAPGSVQVTDLGSTNGTFIDGAELKAMEATVLGVGSEVVFGDQFLAAFRLEEATDGVGGAAKSDPLEEQREAECEADPSQPECRVYDD